MTIVAGAACPEGVVIAGDSRSSVLVSGSTFRTSTYFARKAFSVDDRFIGATFGWATLEGKTISGHIRDFDHQVTIAGDVLQAAQELSNYFNARMTAHVAAGYDPPPPAGSEPIGFMLGGYDTNGIGRLLRVFPWSGTIQDIAQTNNPGGGWSGEADVMTRLVKGYDMARIDASKWAKRNRKALTEAEYIVNFGWFALQDAVDWTIYVARTTIDTQRFTNGTIGNSGAIPTTGGEIEVASVTPGDVVQWIRRMDLRA